MQITGARVGQFIRIPAPAGTSLLSRDLQELLTFEKTVFFQGPELKARQKLKAENKLKGNPRMEVQRIEMHTRTDDGYLLFGAGYLTDVRKTMERHGVELVINDLRARQLEAPQFENIGRQIPNVEFRPGQLEILAIIATNDDGVFDAPTGFGKTFLMCCIACAFPNSRIAFVSKGLDLINGAESRLRQTVPGEVGVVGDGRMEYDKRVLLVSADSLGHVPLPKMDIILYDEVHTATENVVKALMRQSTDARFFGFSATPEDRADGGHQLFKCLFGPVRFVKDYQSAVQDGSVLQIHYRMTPVPLAFGMPIVTANSFLPKKAAYWTNRRRNQIISHAVREAIAEYGDDVQILCICSTVEHVFSLRQFLPEFTPVYADVSPKMRKSLVHQGLYHDEFVLNKQLIAEYTDRGLWSEEDNKRNMKLVQKLREQGEWKAGDYMSPARRAHLLKEFEAGRLKRVIANMCWKQGIDPVHLEILVRADGETSTITGVQLAGRPARLNRGSGKTNGLIIDFDDAWCDYTRDRANARERVYKSKGFVKEQPIN